MPWPPPIDRKTTPLLVFFDRLCLCLLCRAWSLDIVDVLPPGGPTRMAWAYLHTPDCVRRVVLAGKRIRDTGLLSCARVVRHIGVPRSLVYRRDPRMTPYLVVWSIYSSTISVSQQCRDVYHRTGPRKTNLDVYLTAAHIRVAAHLPPGDSTRGHCARGASDSIVPHCRDVSWRLHPR